jgi:predicted DNA-binding protein (MmcQ/YjbR family)
MQPMTDDPRFARPVFARLQRMCLALPEVSVKTMWGHPGFRVGTKTFCVLEIVRGRPSIGFKIGTANAKRFARRRQFFITPYGRMVWVSRYLDDEIDWKEITTLLQQSYRLSATRRSVSTARSARLLGG